MHSSQDFILVVEDDQDIRETLIEMLTDEGFVVHGEINGQEALEFLNRSSKNPSLILLDFMMPVMDGYEFRQKQIEKPELAKIPTVFLSADGRLEKKAVQLGVHEFIKKPINIDKLFEVAEKYCSH
jgi:CheY-like chemotaxis protein